MSLIVLDERVACLLPKKREMINRALVKRLMHAQGWTHHALAEATGIDAGNLYRILSGQQEPRVGAAIRIAQRRKVRVEELFGADDCGR